MKIYKSGTAELGDILPQDELEAKYFDNASFCISEATKEKSRDLLAQVNRLEEVADMKEIIALLA